jgi:16S rRNA processing protein RimM
VFDCPIQQPLGPEDCGIEDEREPAGMDFPRPDLTRARKRPTASSAPSLHPAAGSRPPMGSIPRASASPGNSPQWVLIAQIARPHGRHGEVVAEILTDFPERFHDRTRLWLVPPPRIGTPQREVRLENFWFLRSRVILKLQAIDSMNDAESLRGYGVAIPAAERAPLESGSWYAADLIGCRLIDLDGNADVGEIVDVDRGSSSTDLLVVSAGNPRSARREVLIPFVRDYLVSVDTAARRVEMRLPAGLLDINGPMTEEEKHLHGRGR